MLTDHTWIKSIRLGPDRRLVMERTVYGPRSRTWRISLRGRTHVIAFQVHRFALNGTDNG